MWQIIKKESHATTHMLKRNGNKPYLWDIFFVKHSSEKPSSKAFAYSRYTAYMRIVLCIIYTQIPSLNNKMTDLKLFLEDYLPLFCRQCNLTCSDILIDFMMNCATKFLNRPYRAYAYSH